MIVCKFGGSIILGSKGVNFIKRKVSENPERKVIIVSAIGKSSRRYDRKLTDLLFEAYNKRYTNEFNQYFAKIQKKLINFCKQLNINHSEMLSFEKFKYEFYNESIEYIVSRGEYFTAKIIAKYLNYTFLPAENFLFSDNYHNIDLNKSKFYLQKYKFNTPCIVPGYYYCNTNNEICLLNRGGGDTTGAIIANLLNVKLYENYTNVNGILTAAPKLLKNTPTIYQMNYAQALLCTLTEAKVFASEAIKYLLKSKIKTKIINAKNSGNNSTLIGKSGSFYYLFTYKNFNVYNEHNKAQKQRLVQDFFNVFMSHKTQLNEVIYYNKKIYYSINDVNQISNCLCLNLFKVKHFTALKKALKFVCKNFNITLIEKRKYSKLKYKTLYFLGNYNDNFINEIITNLKGLTKC